MRPVSKSEKEQDLPQFDPRGAMNLTEAQITSFNEFQKCGLMHPFTCGNDHDGVRELIATQTGLKCPSCDYSQDWALQFMLDGSWKKMYEANNAILQDKRNG